MVRTLATSLPVGALVVGKSTHAVHELQEWMAEIALWGTVGMAVLAAVGGLTAGLILARRVDKVNDATARIMQGHLGDRLPPIGLGSEFATLRDNLNRMLERLEASMEAMRHVSSVFASLKSLLYVAAVRPVLAITAVLRFSSVTGSASLVSASSITA